MSFFSKLTTIFGLKSSSNEYSSASTSASQTVSNRSRSSTSNNPQSQNSTKSKNSVRPATSSTQKIIPPKKNSSKIFITIELLGLSATRVEVDKNMTGQELRQYIFDNFSTELGVNDMSLYYQGVKLTKTKKLSELVIVVGTELKIVQGKIDIAEVSAIIADANGIDPLTDEVGTAKMSCGHHIGKDSMTALIRSLISSNKFQIRCPNYDEDNQPCLALWDYSICKKIGVFTKTQMNEFQNGLSNNWLKENAKSCPQCKITVSKYKLETNKVKCPRCGFGDFCYLCLNKWKGPDNKYCANQECKFLNEFIGNSPINKKFMLRDRNNPTLPRVEYTTPQYRSCVHCLAIIEHGERCKHMQCRSCKKSFCWVCLSIPKNGIYPCGEFNDYCGKVSQRQKFGNAAI